MVKDSWVIEVEIEKSAAISGSDGKYISVANGAIAVMTPRKMVKKVNELCMVISSHYRLKRVLRVLKWLRVLWFLTSMNNR